MVDSSTTPERHWLIRAEQDSDASAISALIARAFGSAAHRSGTEQFIVDALRREGALAVSLVAEQAGEIRGHVAFSPVSLSDGSPHWYGLGPAAVEPAWQGRGIGSSLIRAGLERLSAIGAAGCVVLGEPAYYRRFGFAREASIRYPGPPPDYFMALRIAASMPQGEVVYHAAFAADA